MSLTQSTLYTIVATWLGIVFCSSSAWASSTPGWNVDCGNYCFFSEFSHNCQGVYWQDDAGKKSYSSWSTTYNACEEADFLLGTFHIITTDLITCGCPTPSVYPPSDQSAAMTTRTRTSLELLRAQIQSWAPCAADPGASYSDLFNPISYKDLDTCQHLRKTGKKSEFISVGSACYSGLAAWTDPSWQSCNYSGDEVNNADLICMSGDLDRCANIKDAQDPVTGGVVPQRL